MKELRIIFKNALAILVGLFAVVAFGMVDTIVAGRYDSQALAVLAVASAFFITVYVTLLGTLQGLLPIWSEIYGKKDYENLGYSFRQSFYLSNGACLVGMVILFNPSIFLNQLEIPEEMLPQVKSYLAIVGWALPSAFFFRLYGTLNQSLGRPQLVTWIQVIALLVKIPASTWLVFGGFGIPSLGIVGCAWATLIVDMIMAIIALVLLLKSALYKPFKLWKKLENPNLKTLKEFLLLGIPSALTLLVEISSVSFMALLVARVGATALSGQQIAANLSGFIYMIPLSIAISFSARIGFFRGQGNEYRAKVLAWLGVKIGIVSGLIFGGLTFFGRNLIPTVYSSDLNVIAMASTLLFWVSFYHLFDSIQCMCLFILRCWRVTILPFFVYCATLWGFGLGGGFYLTYHQNKLEYFINHPRSFWIGNTLALLIASTVFILLLKVVLNKEKLNK